MAWTTRAINIAKEQWARLSSNVAAPESVGLNRADGWGGSYFLPLDQGGKAPEGEVFNQLFGETQDAVGEIMRTGIADWSAQVDYPFNALVQHEHIDKKKRVYRSVGTTGPGSSAGAVEPGTDSNHWVIASFLAQPVRSFDVFQSATGGYRDIQIQANRDVRTFSMLAFTVDGDGPTFSPSTGVNVTIHDLWETVFLPPVIINTDANSYNTGFQLKNGDSYIIERIGHNASNTADYGKTDHIRIYFYPEQGSLPHKRATEQFRMYVL